MNDEPTIRKVIFSAPGETPVIYWQHGHVAADDFLALYREIEDAPRPLDSSHIKHGWGSRKLDFIVMHLSGTPLEGFEPITYWIPADHAEMVMA